MIIHTPADKMEYENGKPIQNCGLQRADAINGNRAESPPDKISSVKIPSDKFLLIHLGFRLGLDVGVRVLSGAL